MGKDRHDCFQAIIIDAIHVEAEGSKGGNIANGSGDEECAQFLARMDGAGLELP